MLERIVELSLKNRFLVLTGVLLMVASGMYAAWMLPIDAVPDLTNVQVQVVTEAGSLSPLEVEQYVTYPIESTMGGLPDVEEVRSVSKFGLSLVTIVFREGTDIYWARQLVGERLTAARGALGEGVGDPELGPLTTALGEILQFEVRGDSQTPMELRTLLEWQIAPALREVPGVTEVNAHGGFYKTYEVQLNPDQLAGQQVSLENVLEALAHNNTNAGGGYIVHHDEQRFIRGQAMLKSTDDIGNVVVRSRTSGLPLLIRDLGQVRIAAMTRQGNVTRDGRGEIVTGMVMMLLGENSRRVVLATKARLEEIQQTLPEGVRVEVIYDRADLIGRTLATVLRNLTEGGILVVVVLLLLLGSVRAGLIVALAIPLSMLFATNIMGAVGVTASLMSLGAIDFGLIVDSSVIIVENCMRRISLNRLGRPHLRVVQDASIEVLRPSVFGQFIIAVVYLPILTLQGTEGKLFRPMALTVLFALGGSLLLSVTLMPVLASLLLPKQLKEKEIWLVRWLKCLYQPIVEQAIHHPALTLTLAMALVAASLPVATRLGAEFMPKLDEGDLLVEAVRLPSATLEGVVEVSTRIENILGSFPEVETVFCKTGRPEIANDVMGVHQTDVWVILKSVDQWPEEKSRDQLITQMSASLNRHVPGVAFGFTQPIEMRVDELVAGVKADVAVLLYGDDLEVLAGKGKEIERVLRAIDGAVDVKADYQANIPTVNIRVQPEQLARYGLDAEEVMHTVSAMGGYPAGEVFEGRLRFPIVVKFPETWRENVQLLQQLPVGILNDQVVMLGQVADVRVEESPPGIDHESNRRRTFIQANVRGRDVASFVTEARREVQKQVELPSGYTLRWGGDFENLQSASLRLSIITPIVLLVIWLLLFSAFKSMRLALLIFLAVPMAASGGIFALALRGMPFSISAGVGFIALFGVAVLNGLVWVNAAEHLREDGYDAKTATHEAALIRIRPVLMTALVASLGFLPMATSTTAGAEIQRPLATVVIGGLVTSTLLTAFVVPAIYPWFTRRNASDPRLE
jgi:cobalt-zinc-cadmium resistance protein CzcA